MAGKRIIRSHGQKSTRISQVMQSGLRCFSKPHAAATKSLDQMKLTTAGYAQGAMLFVEGDSPRRVFIFPRQCDASAFKNSRILVVNSRRASHATKLSDFGRGCRVRSFESPWRERSRRSRVHRLR